MTTIMSSRSSSPSLRCPSRPSFDPRGGISWPSFVERVVVTVNQMTKRVSMLAKELLLAKLAAGEPLPALNQGFYRALCTVLRSGQWKHGHDAILTRRRVPEPGLYERRPAHRCCRRESVHDQM